MKNKSFTLIELLVVIVIIGILAGVIMISTSSSIDKANIAKIKVFEESITNSLAANMVSRWPLDEIINTNQTPDQWGSNTGTLYGTNGLPQLRPASECVTNDCFKFDGVDDYVTVASNGLNKFSYQSFTISAWVKPEIIQNYTLIWSYDYTSHVSPYYSQHLRINSTREIYFYWNNGTSVQYIATPAIISKDVWYHIVVTYTSGSQKIYVNSKEEAVGIATDVISYYNQPVWIGKSNFGITKGALIDDVRIYSAAIPSSQIKQNYIAGLNSMFANGNISKQEYNERINNLSIK